MFTGCDETFVSLILISFSGRKQDPGVLERTLKALDERHEALRERISQTH